MCFFWCCEWKSMAQSVYFKRIMWSPMVCVLFKRESWRFSRLTVNLMPEPSHPLSSQLVFYIKGQLELNFAALCKAFIWMKGCGCDIFDWCSPASLKSACIAAYMWDTTHFFFVCVRYAQGRVRTVFLVYLTVFKEQEGGLQRVWARHVRAAVPYWLNAAGACVFVPFTCMCWAFSSTRSKCHPSINTSVNVMSLQLSVRNGPHSVNTHSQMCCFCVCQKRPFTLWVIEGQHELLTPLTNALICVTN